MLFNSFGFIMLFLPCTVCGYFLLNKNSYRAAEVFLLIMSWVFYAWNVPAYLLVIVSSIVANFCISRLICDVKNTSARKLLFFIGLVFNIGLIGYYKYLSFVLWSANFFLHTDFFIKSIVLPLGISFYTIQQISFLIDVYKGDRSNYRFIEYALYVSFFPQLVAGPIVYHTEFLPQLKDETKRQLNFENLTKGLIWFTLGLSKKVMLADRLGRAVEVGYTDVSALSCADAWLVMFAYAFQIYFDFSGYSDMACGIALMFNFELPCNFNSPYKSLSIRDFWKRWHMTLTRFLTAYIYIPLGGSRKGTVRLILNTIVVFLVSGIWHGANYTFIIWGILHGLLLLINRFTSKIGEKVPVFVKWPVNFLSISVLWSLFRANGLKQWIMFIRALISFDGGSISESVLEVFDPYLSWKLLLAVSFIICIFFENNYNRKIKLSMPRIIGGAALLACCLVTLSRTSIFLYFNF